MFNPDDKPRKLAPVTYEIEALDLSAHGAPGLAFTGELEIEIDADTGEPYVAYALAPHPDTNMREIYFPEDFGPGRAIARAVMSDDWHRSEIYDKCAREAEGWI